MYTEITHSIKRVDKYDTSLALFKTKFSGDLLSQDHENYNAARSIWNGMIDKKPALIAQCINSHDVTLCVHFAIENNLQVSVRGGGHNVAGNSVCEDGLMIDFSKMKGIDIDPVKRTAKVQPGVLWRELDADTIRYNLATTGGTVSDTGVAGLTLGGGLGWLMGVHGTSSDNVLSVELVTSKGEIIKVDESHYPDLFWAIRGGGGNYGIVTLFEFQLHVVQPAIHAGMLLYPMEQAKEMFQFYRDYIREAPDELMSYSGFIVLPDGLAVAMILPAWMGDPADAEKWLRPLRSFGSPVADLIAEIPYTQLQSILDTAAPTGLCRYWKSGYFTNLSDELIDRVIQNLATRPSPLSPVLFFHIRGAATRVDSGATAFAHREDQWDSDIISQWTNPEDDQKNISWTRKFWKEIEPMTNGVYVNHLDSDDGNDRVKNAYGANYQKLGSIKKIYDPENFFRLNNNILPG